jgi:signal transduction histidine kinase
MVDGQLVEPGLQFPVADNPSYERLITTKEPVVINDVSHDKLLEPVRELTLKLGTKSLLLVPIMVRGEVIGALGADATETMHQFTGREISLVRAMANQLGIAIENFRLNAETQRRAEQLTVLNELDRAITTSLRLTDIYYAFAQHAIRLLPYHRTSITLLEGDEMRVTYVAGETTGRNGLSVGSMVSPRKSALGWVIEHGQPLLRHDIAADIRSTEDEQLLAADIRSTMIIPLRVKGLIIGTWNIGNRKVGAYSPDDLEIAQSMADQLAVAIENARLYDEIRQRLNELSTLSKISQTITSTLDVQETLSIITDHTTQLLGVAAASVALYNEAEDDLWFAASSGGSADFVRGKRMTKSRGIMGWVVRHGEPVLIPDVSKDERFFGAIDQESGFKTRSIVCVPLQTKGQTIGAIEAMNKASGPFNQEDLRLLTSLAAPAATAIENARLYEQAQQEIIERQRAEAALEEERALLARRVAERTADLSAANVELARAARLKDEFMASMSHELRTPLTAILGLSEVLKSEVYGSLSEKQLKSVNSVEESGRHLLSLINDILDLSKIGAGKLELKVGSVSVEKVCHASLQFIKQAAHKKQLRITSTYDNTVTTLYADERRLKQILVNLLSNAVKFTPEGGEIGLEVAGDVADQMIHFIVWDTGIGIAPEDQKRLFEPFAQLDSRLSRQYPGTGLGLALVQRMAEMHGGEVMLESEVGQGSRFTVSLPWSDFVHPTEAVESIALSTQATFAESPDQEETTGLVSPSAQPPLVLVAEDEESVANLLMDYLLSRGWSPRMGSRRLNGPEKRNQT